MEQHALGKGLDSATECQAVLIDMFPCISLQDTRLNYVEQHASRLGMDSSRLEAARVSASRSSPMGEALDAAARYVDTASLGETKMNMT